MSSCIRSVVAFSLTAASSVVSAQGLSASVTSAVNVRAGPDRAFPIVTWLPSGTTVEVGGCVASLRWCDVVAGRHRGWVYTRYLAVQRDGRSITIRDGGPSLRLPLTDFSAGAYWDEHYRDMPWFGRKSYWQDHSERRRPASEGQQASMSPATRPPDVHTSRGSLDWAGVYEGTLPCGGCPGLETRLRLALDGTFELVSQRREGPPATVRGSFSWEKDGNVIQLDASAGGQRFAVGEGRLMLLEREDRPDWSRSSGRTLERTQS